MIELTKEQAAAISARGKVIVSASAGSGKTFVMIQKLVNLIEDGADLDDVLAVTFTKKAASQMKEKLRSELIKRMDGADGEKKARLKLQLSKISSANISTIHALCAKLIRTYFYVLDTDGGFDIISSDDAVGKELKKRAAENVFERFYESGDEGFLHLLGCYTRKRSDAFLKNLLLSAYEKLRSTARYGELLAQTESLYTDEGFERVCAELRENARVKYLSLKTAVEKFRDNFPVTVNAAAYSKIFGEMLAAVDTCLTLDIFAEKPPFVITRKPADPPLDKNAGEIFKTFKSAAADRYSDICNGLADREKERAAFFASGKTAVAFARLVREFDAEYSSLKREENKLDYNDLEHMTLKLLLDETVRAEINSGFKYVYVDEYQDVNPVQEEIISGMGEEVFLVGDVKQAIYGFRGSRSLFFAEKYNRFEGGGGTALRLTGNFRSCNEVINFVNRLFSDAMRESVCGFDYAGSSVMTGGGLYPQNCGSAEIRIFGKDEKRAAERGVYSVKEDSRKAGHSREGLAVLEIVKRELAGKHYDLKTGGYVDTQAGDICILTRKNKGASVEGIVHALKDAGYSVSGAKENNICVRPEVKLILDILSLVDNAEQDVPLAGALLSPLGGFCEDELARIRILYKNEKDGNKIALTFRECCKRYAAVCRDGIAEKLRKFYNVLERYRDLAEVVKTGELVDAILSETGLEAVYSAGAGEKLKNVLRLAEEGAELTLPAFLRKIKSGGYNVSSPSSASSDSIKLMTMHASKGLEFPVVIIADVCKPLRGREANDMPFDEVYAFAPKAHDGESMLTSETVLRRLVKMRADREEIKNELNLFYVACTRAMCKLHVMAERLEEPAPDASEAKNYAQTFDMSAFAAEEISPADIEREERDGGAMIAEPDPIVYGKIAACFGREYEYADSVDLPVKSSASAILRARDDEPVRAVRKLFSGEGETGTERGIAYHRFLELCDFAKKDAGEIEEELTNFVQSGRMTAAQAELLNSAELEEILRIPVFADLLGAELYREREFLCRLPANEIMETSAEDGVLVQGAIDLFARGDFGLRIIDYKYSGKSDGELLKDYAPQLRLYKKAAAKITGYSESAITTFIVNIFARRLIEVK